MVNFEFGKTLDDHAGVMDKKERKNLAYALDVTKFRLKKAIQQDLENQESKQKFATQI